MSFFKFIQPKEIEKLPFTQRMVRNVINWILVFGTLFLITKYIGNFQKVIVQVQSPIVQTECNIKLLSEGDSIMYGSRLMRVDTQYDFKDEVSIRLKNITPTTTN